MKTNAAAALEPNRSEQPARRTDQYPAVVHPCIDGLGTMFWRRPAIDGIEATCRCGTRFRYVKAAPRGGSDAPQGPRSHF